MPKVLTIPALAIFPCWALLAAESSQPPAEGIESETAIFDLMAVASRGDREPLSIGEAYAQSALIVIGYMDSVHPGRTLRHVEDSDTMPPLTTVIFEIDVTDAIKGRVEGETVYFEYVAGGIKPELFEEVKYDNEVLLFLRKPTWRYEEYTIPNLDAGLMDEIGDDLYSLTTSDGLIVEMMGRLSAPLGTAGDVQEDPLLNGSTLEEFKRKWGNAPLQ